MFPLRDGGLVRWRCGRPSEESARRLYGVNGGLGMLLDTGTGLASSIGVVVDEFAQPIEADRSTASPRAFARPTLPCENKHCGKRTKREVPVPFNGQTFTGVRVENDQRSESVLVSKFIGDGSADQHTKAVSTS